MNIDYGSDTEMLRGEIQTFLRDGVPSTVKEKLELRKLSGVDPSYSNLTKDEYIEWHNTLPS
jgi:hypothetical protein